MQFRNVAVVMLLFLVAGCTSWERSTFQTLSAAKAVINQGKADYISGAIPVNKCSQAILNQATAADTLAVQGFDVYEQEKKAASSKTALAAQQAVVQGLLTDLAPLISDVALLKSNPIAACAGVKL